LIFLLFPLSCIFSYGQSKNVEIEKRLLELQTAVPMYYNDAVADCIHKMQHEKRKETQKLLEDFLPCRAFFQSELLKAGLPQEFCYLPLMLQKMQRENNSFFDMAGLWNIPFLVAVKYGLTVNNQIDERYDMQKSTQVAIACLSAIKKEKFALWDVIIAYSNSLAAHWKLPKYVATAPIFGRCTKKENCQTKIVFLILSPAFILLILKILNNLM